jgi:hypothetical protein
VIGAVESVCCTSIMAVLRGSIVQGCVELHGSLSSASEDRDAIVLPRMMWNVIVDRTESMRPENDGVEMDKKRRKKTDQALSSKTA